MNLDEIPSPMRGSRCLRAQRSWLGLVVLLLLLLLTSLYECSSLKDELEQLTRRHAGVAKKSHERMEEMTQKLMSAQRKFNDLTTCEWQMQKSQCFGLSFIEGVKGAEDCQEVCCRMRKNFCSTWQFQEGNGCWLGIPDQDCSSGDCHQMCSGNDWDFGGQRS